MKDLRKEGTSSNGFSRSFRWVLLLPVAVLAAVLITFPLHWILYATLSGGSDPFVTPYPAMPERLLQPMVSAMAFVYVSGIVAPHGKLIIGRIAGFLWCLLIVVAIFIGQQKGLDIRQMIRENYFGAPVIFGILGTIIGLRLLSHQLKKDDFKQTT